MSEQSGEKEFEATEGRLNEARKKGDIPRSNEVTTFAVYGGFFAGLMLFGGVMTMNLGSDLAAFISHAPQLAMGPSTMAIIGKAIGFLCACIAVPWVCVWLILIAQRSVIFATDKILPKLNRISPLQNVKNKYGINGLFEFLKSATKLVVFSVTLGFYLSAYANEIIAALVLSPGAIVLLIGEHILGLLFVVVLISAAIGCIDFAWQRAQFRKRMMMTRQDLKDDLKQTEGDPTLKQQRRQRATEIALNTMMVDTETADVVIVNPTHYAVALKWDRDSLKAPICVAKGVDEIAARIRKIAQENAVPIKSDPSTARALYATVEVGEEVGRDHYKAVAAAIRFAEALRQKAKHR